MSEVNWRITILASEHGLSVMTWAAHMKREGGTQGYHHTGTQNYDYEKYSALEIWSLRTKMFNRC